MTPGRRILLISLHNAPEQTGNAPYVSSLARGLVKAGWSVRLISAHPHYPQWSVHEGFGQWRRVDIENGVRVERVRHYVPNRPSALRRLLAELSFGMRAAFSRWGRPDIVVLVSPALIASAVAMTKARSLRGRVPVVTWVQDLYGRGMAQTATGNGHARRVIERLERDLMRTSDRVIVIHDRFSQIAQRSFDLAPAEVDVVRNWSHLAAREASAATEEVRSARGWGDEIVVLHGGNQGVKQGLENVVEAARLADERGADVRFVLVGHGSRNADLRLVAEGIQRIEFIGPLDDEDYTAILAAADVLLVNELAGVSDMAVPSKLTSYFRAGRPVVAASEAGSITAEEIDAAGAGIRVDAARPDALLDAVLELGRDPDRRAEMGAAAQDFARRHLDESAAVSAFSSVLGDVLSRGSTDR